MAFGLAGSISALEKDADGIYQISDADGLVEFAALVNGGEAAANAVLTADIDLTGVSWTPIGGASTKFSGTFDGQGHAITGFSYTATADYNGIFGYITGATVRGFSVEGELTSTFKQNGVVGQADGASVVSDIHSALNINVSGAKGHTGGIVGGSGTSGSHTLLLERCEYSGTLTHSGTGDCQGGILGYTYQGTIRNCIFSGAIHGENNKYGGILGYCKVPEFGGIQNCLSVGTITCDAACTTAAALIANWNGGATTNVSNNYYLLGAGSSDNVTTVGNKTSSVPAPTLVTSEQLASGEITYALNGDQSDIAFFQNLDTDPLPTLDASHPTVYLVGRQHCDGTAYDGATYSNTGSTSRDDHDFTAGFCTYCGSIDPSFASLDAEGRYEISDAAQLVWFAALVGEGNYNACAVLTADIDMQDADISRFPIGTGGDTAGKRYVGTFDGRGHKLSNFQLVNPSAAANYGLFNTATGVVLKDFWLDQTCAIEGRETVGLVGRHYGGGTFEGIGNCADVTGTQNNVGGLIGAVFGNDKDKKQVTITNCWTTGRVTTTNPSAGSGKDCGALTGWFNNATITITGFWTISEVANPKADNMYVYRNGAGASFTVTNSFSMNGSQSGYTNFTEEQLASGEIAYGLGSAWSQLIGTDPQPVLWASNPVFYVGDAGYATMYDTTSDLLLCGNAQAYTAHQVGTWLTLSPIDDVPAGTPVVLRGTYYNKVSTSATSDTSSNQLLGTDSDTEADGTMYVLAEKDETIGFYKATGTIPAGKAYFQSNSGVKAFLLDEDDATGIGNLPTSHEEATLVFDLAGRRIQKMQKGINVTAGRKILR